MEKYLWAMSLFSLIPVLKQYNFQTLLCLFNQLNPIDFQCFKSRVHERSPNLVKVIKYRKFIWALHVARIEESWNAFKILACKHINGGTQAKGIWKQDPEESFWTQDGFERRVKKAPQLGTS